MHRCWATKLSENILVRGLWEGCGKRPNVSPFAHQRSSHEQKQKDLFWRFYNILIFIFILFIQYAPFWGKDYVRPFPNTLIGTESKGKMTKYWHFFCFCNALLHENLFFLAENRWSCDGVFSLSIQMRHGYEYISVDFQPRKYKICFLNKNLRMLGRLAGRKGDNFDDQQCPWMWRYGDFP